MDSLEKIRNITRQILLEEGSFLLQESASRNSSAARHSGSQPETDTKSSFSDLVTDTDIKIEQRLIERLSKLLPGSQFLAEESAGNDYQSDKLWIIDPIDGTTNFVHNFPFFCISVALQLDGELTLGFVYNPVMDEFFEAQKDKGSILNNRIIKVSSVPTLSQSLLATGFAYNFSVCKENNINYFQLFQAKSQGIRRLGSAALDICYVAKGVLDGFWELFLNPWDVAAGMLIVTEAGGRVSNFQGQDYSFEDKGILITNNLLHNEMVTEMGKAVHIKKA